MNVRLPLLVVALVLVPRLAQAQGGTPQATPPTATPADPTASASPETIAEARRRFDQGTALFKDGDYKLALIEFEKTYELIPNYQVLYSIGQVNFQLNNYTRALKALKQYLAQGGSAVPAERRTAVENDIAALEKRIAYVSITADKPDVEVSIDDRVIGTAPLQDVMIDGGEHRISGTKPGFTSALKIATLAGGEHGNVELTLKELPRDDSGKTRIAPIISWSVTGALVVGTVVTGVLALSSASELKDAREAPAAPTDTSGVQKRAEIDDKESTTHSLATVSTFLLGASIIGGVVSAYLTLHKDHSVPVTPKESAKSSVRVGGGLGSFLLSGSF